VEIYHTFNDLLFYRAIKLGILSSRNKVTRPYAHGCPEGILSLYLLPLPTAQTFQLWIITLPYLTELLYHPPPQIAAKKAQIEILLCFL
jgi:hypothetical protein